MTDGVAALALTGAGLSLFVGGALIAIGALKWVGNRKYLRSLAPVEDPRAETWEQLHNRLNGLNKRFAATQRIANMGLWEYDCTNDYLWWSDQVYRIFGLDSHATLTSSAVFNRLVHPDDRMAVRAANLEALTHRKPFEVFHRIVNPDGTVRVVHECAEIIRNDQGRATFMIGTVQDVTDQKETEQVLRSSKDRAEAANRIKTEFLANVSHELRTPLNSIIGFTEIMREEVFGPFEQPKYLEYAADVNDSGRHLLSLINDVLDVSVIESGNFALDDGPTAVAPMIDACRRLIIDRAVRAGIDLNMDMQKPFPMLQIDQRRMKQILLNLLSNAVKFTPQGGTVTLRAWLDTDNGAVFQVADNGIGIAKADIEAVLAPFGQAAQSGTKPHDGVGLGLPLSKSLAELHGGSLDIESKSGEGTQVTVRLGPERTLNIQTLGERSKAIS